MGLLDGIRDKVLGGGGSSGQAALLQGVLDLLGQGGAGGLAGLAKVFQERGLADIVSSWIGTGENLPISSDQLLRGLGAEQLQQLAAKAGLSPEVAGPLLAKMLPGIVDKLTPNGTIPDGGVLAQSLHQLKSKLT